MLQRQHFSVQWQDLHILMIRSIQCRFVQPSQIIQNCIQTVNLYTCYQKIKLIELSHIKNNINSLKVAVGRRYFLSKKNMGWSLYNKQFLREIQLFLFLLLMMEARHNIRVYDSDAAVIQLIGDMKENVQQLIKAINCKCGINGHLRAILTIYTNKINKLRSQRDTYRRKYQELLCQTNANVYMENNSMSNQYETINMTLGNDPQRPRQTDSNIFQLLHKELYFPASVNSKYFQQQSSVPFILTPKNTSSNTPEDSLLLTQSSYNRLQGYIPQKSKTATKSIGKSFQEFLKEKVQQNHAKIKVTQDLLSLSNRKNVKKLQSREPLVDRFNINH